MRERLSVVATLAVGAALLAAGAGAQNAGVRLVVTPPTSLLDQAVNVHVVGLHPRQTITLVTETKDVLGKLWRSRLAYRADQHGRVNTHGHMRLLWALEPIRKSAEPSPFIPTVGPTTVTIRAVAGKRTLATGSLVRRAGAHVTRTDATLAREGFVGGYFAPGTRARGAAVLQLGGAQGSYGYFPAAVLAGHGYPTLSLAYFNEPGLPKTLKEIPLEYFAKALRWLGAQPGVVIHMLADLLTDRVDLGLEVPQDGRDRLLHRGGERAGLRAIAFVGLHPDQRVEPAHQRLQLAEFPRQGGPEGRVFRRGIVGDEVRIDRIGFRARQPTLGVVVNDRGIEDAHLMPGVHQRGGQQLTVGPRRFKARVHAPRAMAGHPGEQLRAARGRICAGLAPARAIAEP